MIRLILHIFLVLFIIGCQNSNKSFLDKERLSNIDVLINQAIENNEIPGAVVLVGNAENIVYHKAYGTSNPETNKEYKEAESFYNQCLSMKGFDYERGIHQKAKAGLGRITN